MKVITAYNWAYMPCIARWLLKRDTYFCVDGDDVELSWFFPKNKVVVKDLFEGELAVKGKSGNRMGRILGIELPHYKLSICTDG